VVTTAYALTLPWPVSANRYWRSFIVGKGPQRRVAVFVSDEAKAYRREVALRLKQAGIRIPITGRISLALTLHPQRPLDADRRMRKLGDAWDDDVRSIDLDNSIKVLVDALKGHAFADDKWVWRIDAARGEPLPEPCVKVTIGIVPYIQPQSGLFEEATHGPA